MTVIFEETFEPTIDNLVARFADGSAKTVEAWVFADTETRRKAEETLAAKGITARFRSAYKPLVHFFSEDVRTDGLVSAAITYPVHPEAPENRFLLEAYPLSGLLGDTKVSFAPATDGSDLFYTVVLSWSDGRSETKAVFAPNRLHDDFAGEQVLSPTGWLSIDGAEGARLKTDYEALFSRTMQAIAAHRWGDAEPFFEELNITASLPAEDEWLPLSPSDALISLREALHEDFYFSLLEVFQTRSGRPLGDRGLRPGQIVPEIRFAAGPARVRVETRPLNADETDDDAGEAVATAANPFSAARVRRELETIEGEAFAARSRAGRAVSARYHRGSDRPVMISGGQHPNEVTGIAGALRAGLALAERPNVHFTISPLENPDGYAVDNRLRADNPRHMHHAARYTAFGDDLEYRPREAPFETGIRFQAEAISGALLHVNLHGYPAHEWTRPLSGYVPRGFAMWTVPKGFFLIMRHKSGWEEQARTLIDRVTERLGQNRALVDFNARQIDLYIAHSGTPTWPVINGFPVMISVDDRHRVPLTLITEYPDETIYGDAFIQGHTAQLETALGAYEAWQDMVLPEAS
ncbi:peptidase M14 [Martelella endophytica]|uniref:Peptidase M14 n=1 Tax=Martelella endophytica TaxID=1486262 RepID=A0A0D5LKK5_MAREN|nr:peptidase M14 [Martelella endophytica]AJY44470.1 peptidase M14 [Martelella endophytica]